MSSFAEIQTAAVEWYGERKSSINFTAVFRLVNGVTDLIFFGFLIFEDEEDSAGPLFVLSFGILLGVIFRLLASMNYTPYGPSSSITTVVNVLCGSSFKVHRSTSVKRSRLQEYPLGKQVSDQLNSHLIADSFQGCLSFYAAFIVAFASDATSGSNFYFYLVKFCIVAITLLFDVLFQELGTLGLVNIVPSGIAFGMAPVLFYISKFYTSVEDTDGFRLQQNILISSLKFMALITILFIRLATFARKTLRQKRTSDQISTGSLVLLAFLALLLWDFVTLVTAIGKSYEIGDSIEYLASIMLGAFCLIMYSCPWRRHVLYNHWLEQDGLLHRQPRNAHRHRPNVNDAEHYTLNDDIPSAFPYREEGPASTASNHSVSNEMFDEFNATFFDATPQQATL